MSNSPTSTWRKEGGELEEEGKKRKEKVKKIKAGKRMKGRETKEKQYIMHGKEGEKINERQKVHF